MSKALARLLSPVATADFLGTHWGREFLFCKGTPTRFSDLFQWSSVERILSTHRFDFPRLRLVRRGKIIPASDYMRVCHDRRGNSYVCHLSAKVAEEMNRGAMLHITSVNDTWEPLAEFAAALELDLTARVQVNLHAALARSKGFATHWDGHDVYVMQVAGKKAWRLFGSTETAPLAVPPDQKHHPPHRILREIVLEAGDMLYLPRGYWHAAEALEDISLHLTFAAQHPTGLDFLSWLTKRIESETIPRRDIPIDQFIGSGGWDVTSAQYVGELNRILGEKIRPALLNEFLEEYRSALGQTNHVQLDGGTNVECRSSETTYRRARS